ncbi:MAG: hypothetical protein ACFFB5_24195 [Promethearchaeota archaeon]
MSSRALYKSLLTNHLFYRVLLDYMLAHHPECAYFSSHTWKVGSLRLCKSCTGAFLLTIGLSIILLLFPRSLTLFSNPQLDLVLLLLLTPFVILYLIGVGNNNIRNLLRIIFVIFAITLALSFFSVPMGLEKILFLAWISVGFLVLYRQRKIKMLKICDACEYKADFNQCPGTYSFRKLIASIG